MKYKINDKVIVKYDGQIVKGQVIQTRQTWFGNRYCLYFTVTVHDEGTFKYTKSAYKSYWERQIIGIWNTPLPSIGE